MRHANRSGRGAGRYREKYRALTQSAVALLIPFSAKFSAAAATSPLSTCARKGELSVSANLRLGDSTCLPAYLHREHSIENAGHRDGVIAATAEKLQQVKRRRRALRDCCQCGAGIAGT